MNIQQEILSIVGKFDEAWYTGIKTMFIAEQVHGYDAETKRIKRTIPRTGHDASTGEEYNADLNINSSIEEYAWDYDFENNVFEGDTVPVQGKYIAKNIEGIIADHINQSNDVTEQDEFITKALTIVLSKISDFKKANVNAEYSSILSHFYKVLKAGISGKYRDIRRVANKKRNFESFVRPADQLAYKENDPIANHEIEKPVTKNTLSHNNIVIQNPKVERQYLDDVFLVLSPYFEEEQRIDLEHLLRTGDNETGALLFKGSGSALCYFFRQLIDYHVIVIRPKLILHDWLSINFKYIHNREPKVLTPKYAGRYISEDNKVPKTNHVAKFSIIDKMVIIEPLKSNSRARNLNS